MAISYKWLDGNSNQLSSMSIDCLNEYWLSSMMIDCHQWWLVMIHDNDNNWWQLMMIDDDWEQQEWSSMESSLYKNWNEIDMLFGHLVIGVFGL